MRVKNHKEYPPEVYAKACEWFVEFRASMPDESTRRDFCCWLQEGPTHMAAYLDVATQWTRMGAFDVQARFPKELLISEAMGDADNVVSHPRTPRLQPSQPLVAIWRRLSCRPICTLVVIAAVTVIAGAIGLTAWIRANPTYSTGIGQQRVISLADGSVIDMSPRSEIRVHYTETERMIDLVRGEALFRDTQNSIRPFIVTTRETLVRAVGTEFDVNRQSTSTVVTVVAGKVAVANANSQMTARATHSHQVAPRDSSAQQPVYLTAGEQVRIRPPFVSRPVLVNVSDVVAWTHRELIFVAAPLQDVVDEFNRYNVRQLVIADPSLDTFKIDGVFSSVKPSYLIDFLRQYPGIKVRESERKILISRR